MNRDRVVKLPEPSQATRDRFVGLALKSDTMALSTPFGELKRPEFEAKRNELPFGPYFGYDNFLGHYHHWHLPLFSEVVFKKLSYCIRNISDYSTKRRIYKEIIRQVPGVKWHLIFTLLCGCESNLKSSSPSLNVLPDWDTPELLNNRELFASLVEDGAEYRHYVQGGYHVVGLRHLDRYLHLFGEQATSSTYEGLNLISEYLIGNQGKDPFLKVAAVLRAGADINACTDSRFGNTVLHYLTALEDETFVCELIDIVEQLQNKEHIQGIDYARRDKFDKTVLLMAVGLGLERIVSKLLTLKKDKQKDIGIDMPDEKGRTPAMLAAALGRKDILQHLVDHGANLSINDGEGRGVFWYASAPEVVVRDIFQSLSVNPNRGACCDVNSYLCSSGNGVPWLLIDKEGKEHMLLLSADEEHFEKLVLAVYLAPSDESRTFMLKQLRNVCEFAGPNYKKSITTLCLERQAGTRTMLEGVRSETSADSIPPDTSSDHQIDAEMMRGLRFG